MALFVRLWRSGAAVVPLRTFADRLGARVPKDEARPLKTLFYKLQVALYSILPATQPGLPPIDADPMKALDEAYPAAYRKLFPAPAMPEEYRSGIDLGRLAVASPY